MPYLVMFLRYILQTKSYKFVLGDICMCVCVLFNCLALSMDYALGYHLFLFNQFISNGYYQSPEEVQSLATRRMLILLYLSINSWKTIFSESGVFARMQSSIITLPTWIRKSLLDVKIALIFVPWFYEPCVMEHGCNLYSFSLRNSKLCVDLIPWALEN